MAYSYCTSLIFEFWQVPLNIEYGSLARLAAHKTCEQCVSHQFGSSLYVQCVAVAGLLSAVWDIYSMIGAEPTQVTHYPFTLGKTISLMIKFDQNRCVAF